MQHYRQRCKIQVRKFLFNMASWSYGGKTVRGADSAPGPGRVKLVWVVLHPSVSKQFTKRSKNKVLFIESIYLTLKFHLFIPLDEKEVLNFRLTYNFICLI